MNEDKSLFQIDLMAKAMPTFEQFKTIYSNCVHGTDCKEVLKTVYPLLSDKLTKSKDLTVTFKALGVNNDRGFKVFSENEYLKIHEAFAELVDKHDPEIDPSLIFKAPLIVDWDQNLIACDEDGLENILAKYRAELSEQLSHA